MSTIFTQELFMECTKSLFDSLVFFTPYLKPLIISFIIITIVKHIVRHFTYDISIISGYTRKQSKRRARKASDAVDLFSTLYDVKDIFKR